MLKVIPLILFMGIANLGFSQSGEEIHREANPTVVESNVNTPQALDWRAVLEARKSGDETRYFQLLNDYNAAYSESFFVDRSSFNKPHDAGIQKVNPPFQTDWANGDNMISAGGVPNPGIFERNMRLNVDSTGTQYCAYITDNRDTLVIFRSTDEGEHWSRWRAVLPGGTTKWHSFDMYITDSTGGHRIGIVASRTTTTSTLNGQVYFLSYTSGGTFMGATLIAPTPAGRGHIEPTIVSDGRDWSPGLTYWYVAFRNVDASTGVGDSAVSSYSSNWGNSWLNVLGIRSFDDYDLDIDYNFRADSIYVLLTNDITGSNPNLRLMRISLGNLGSGGSWTQNNVASTSDPEDLGEIAVARNDEEMAIVYTREVSGTDKIYYDFWNGGGYWNNDAVVFNQPDEQTIAALDCNIGQWAWRMCFQVNAGTDTIVYMSTTSPSSGFVGRQVVSNNPPTGTVAPDVAGFINPNSGGVAYVQFGGTPIWYDNSNIVTNITGSTDIPETYELSQNYPNPFNPSTTIKYNIPKAGDVKLVVFDALGREVVQLVNGTINAGSHSIDFNASGLSSGIYFYRLTSGDFTDIKKMMIVK